MAEFDRLEGDLPAEEEQHAINAGLKQEANADCPQETEGEEEGAPENMIGANAWWRQLTNYAN